MRRFSNQIYLQHIGEDGQHKLYNSKVIVIGAGGKGLAALQHLIAIGVGTIGICDNSIIKENELSKQHLYGLKDLGKQKAIAAKEYILKINHNCQCNLHNLLINKQNIKNTCEQYDLIIDATDDWDTKRIIADYGVENNKPIIVAAVINGEGAISVVNYKSKKQFTEIFSGEENNNSGVCKCFLPAVQYSFIGAVIANEGAKVMLGIDSTADGKVLKIDTFSYSLTVT